MPLTNMNNKTNTFAMPDDNDEILEPQAVLIDKILKDDPLTHSRRAIENMLKYPETMILDDTGKLCLIYIYSTARITQREIWMIFATPVAMAVYLNKYTYAGRLLEAGYKYDIMERFEVYNIEGNNGEFDMMPNVTRLRAPNNIYRYNSMTNLELMTCMLHSPAWINDGVWEELKSIQEETVVFDTVIANMAAYNRYARELVCDSMNNGNDTKVNTGYLYNYNREGEDLFNAECSDRLYNQLKRMICEDIPNLKLQYGAEYSEFIERLEELATTSGSGNTIDYRQTS